MFGRESKKTRERLEREGVRASATVLEISGGHVSLTTGNPQVASNTELPMKVRLRVEPEGEAPFEVRKRLTFPQLGVPRQGGTVPVIFDPADHDELIVDRSSEGGFAMATDLLRQRGAAEGREDLGEVADLVQEASAGGTLDVAGLQRSLMERFAPGGANAPDLGAFPPAEDPVDKLEKLADLRDRGVLSEEEFAAQKARILGEP